MLGAVHYDTDCRSQATTVMRCVLEMFQDTQHITLTVHVTIMLVPVDPVTTSTITLVGGRGTVDTRRHTCMRNEKI